MKEINDILKAYERLQQQGMRAALATVVQVEGSSYRRPGARMLIAEDGRLTGAVSGGCLEGDILRKALHVMVQGRPQLVTYDSTDEDDTLGVSLGCNGIVHIFIEPIAADEETNPIQLLKHFAEHRSKAVLATIFSASDNAAIRPATSLLIYEDRRIIGSTADREMTEELLTDSKAVFHNGEYATISYNRDGKTYKALIDYLQPPVSLIIVGAGNDAQPLAAMADILGWRTTVVDGRSNYATQMRFPTARQVLVSRPEKIASRLHIDEHTVFVLMTHNYNYDLAALREIICASTPYIGILGPHKKQERLLLDLKLLGVFPNTQQRQKIFGPVGLDIGAETSEEIALSIVAEIKRILASTHGHSLRDKKSGIHTSTEDNLTMPQM